MDAYYAFSDEAGFYQERCGKKTLKSHPFYVRATVLVKVEEYQHYQCFIRELKEEMNIPLKEEIKWSDLWSKIHNQPRARFIKYIDKDDLFKYYRTVLSKAVEMKSLKIIITVTENRNDNIIKKEKMMSFHLQDSLQRVENELRGMGFATFIIDELPDDYSNRVKSICHSIIEEGDIIKYSSLYSGVLFERSNMSVGIQLADYVAGICNSIFKSMSADPNNYTFAKEMFSEYIYPHLRRSDSGAIMGYGVVEVTKEKSFRDRIGSYIAKFYKTNEEDNDKIDLDDLLNSI